MEQNVRSRIAPTPSGFLHKGNALNFVLTYLLTRIRKGKLLLRIDDMDQKRMRPEFLDDIFYTLEWLGMDWDGGPSGPEDHLRNFSQVHRLEDFGKFRQRLLPYSFACQCSRKDIAQNSEDGQYPGTCREINLSYQPPETSLRIKTKSQVISWEDLLGGRTFVDLDRKMRDFVIYKKDGMPAYQLSSLSDDLGMEINLVVRGQDLIDSTGAQLYLAELLGEEAFGKVRFLHHPLIRGEGGEKLSKSAGSISVKYLREQGDSMPFYRWLNELLGISKAGNAQPNTLAELLELAGQRQEEAVLGWLKSL